MKKYRYILECGFILLFTIVILILIGCDQQNDHRKFDSAKKIVKDLDPFMGDYQGEITFDSGEKRPLYSQVIAYGNGQYQINFLKAFDARNVLIFSTKVQKTDQSIQFSKTVSEGEFKNSTWEGLLGVEGLVGKIEGSQAGRFQLKKVVRLSPTLGAKPPEGAIVLFDGTGFDEWEGRGKGGLLGLLFKHSEPAWKLVDGTMEVVPGSGSIRTKRKFRNYKLHLEFRSPFMPFAKGQKRGNSGVYNLERYEVQILDSYGLEGKDNECGAIYKVAAPRVNMCAPPMQWQTYDITFHAPQFDPSGKKVQNARITVVHNGVTIHKDLEIPHPTGGARIKPEQMMGSISLQDHGDPVQFRNIWLVELPDGKR